MFAFTIKRIRYCLNHNRVQPKSILLSYTSCLTQYTFLNIQTSIFGKSLDQTATALHCPQLTHFLSLLRNNLPMLKGLQQSNYAYLDIQRFHNDQKIANESIVNYSQQIKEIASSFVKLTNVIFSRTNKKNLASWMHICLQLQIIDVRIWSYLLKLSHQHLGSLSNGQKLKVMKGLHQYLQCFFMKNTYAPNKYLYRQNAMSDIDCLQEVIILLLKEVVSQTISTNKDELFQAFRIVVELIFKINRAVHIKLYKLRLHYQNKQAQYDQILNNGNITTAVTLLKYLSFLGIYDSPTITNIEDKILHLLEHSETRSFEQRYQYTETILQVWSTFTYNNLQIYQKLVRPTLLQLLNQNQDKRAVRTSTIYRMVCSNIEDDDLIQKLMNQAEQKYPIQSRTAHILAHYLSIKSKRKILSSYPHCMQNKVGLEIASRNEQSYSNCMSRALQDYPQKQKYRPHDVCFQVEVAKEVHPPEQFWQNILQLAFTQLSQLHQHPNNQIIFNFHFCSFEIDALIVVDGQYLACQYEGLHYKMNVEEGMASKGHKIIKHQILEAYGIKILQIDSTDIVVRTISSFRDKQNGAKYLLERLEALYKSANKSQ